MSVQVGAHCLENAQHGRGILLGGVPGVAQANVLVLGGGVAGTNAVLMAVPGERARGYCHERRFSGAILADQRVDFTLGNIQG
jgi:hypothetical protein